MVKLNKGGGKQKKFKMEIRYVDYGVANNFGDYIEMNKNLKQYPKLYKPILAHELKHSKGGLTMEDVRNDFLQKSNVNSWSLFKFMFTHPKSLTQVLPFYYTRSKGFVYDINLSAFMIFLVFYISILIWGASLIVR